MTSYTNRYANNLAGQNFTQGCGNYAMLGMYNAGFRGIRPPVPTTNVSGYYVVPAYSAPGYQTLTHGPPSCGPYFQIQKAYGYGAGSGSFCNQQYMGSICQ
jgi:hypothetical protein